MSKRIFLLIIILGLALAGCSGSGGGAAGSGAVRAVETYYNAIVAQDADQFTGVTCADYEEQALIELDSFQGVETALDGFSCQESGTEGEFTLVKCQGKLVASYGNEKMDFPLADRTHRVKNEGGDWRVCGY